MPKLKWKTWQEVLSEMLPEKYSIMLFIDFAVVSIMIAKTQSIPEWYRNILELDLAKWGSYQSIAGGT